jgi:hypothetical protein
MHRHAPTCIDMYLPTKAKPIVGQAAERVPKAQPISVSKTSSITKSQTRSKTNRRKRSSVNCRFLLKCLCGRHGGNSFVGWSLQFQASPPVPCQIWVLEPAKWPSYYTLTVASSDGHELQHLPLKSPLPR